jgi:hypothetical protein
MHFREDYHAMFYIVFVTVAVPCQWTLIQAEDLDAPPVKSPGLQVRLMVALLTVRRAMFVGQMCIEAGNVKKMGIRVQGPDGILESTQTCMSYANTHFLKFRRSSVAVIW